MNATIERIIKGAMLGLLGAYLITPVVQARKSIKKGNHSDIANDVALYDTLYHDNELTWED